MALCKIYSLLRINMTESELTKMYSENVTYSVTVTNADHLQFYPFYPRTWSVAEHTEHQGLVWFTNTYLCSGGSGVWDNCRIVTRSIPIVSTIHDTLLPGMDSMCLGVYNLWSSYSNQTFLKSYVTKNRDLNCERLWVCSMWYSGINGIRIQR
jgi:hypothetical protein